MREHNHIKLKVNIQKTLIAQSRLNQISFFYVKITTKQKKFLNLKSLLDFFKLINQKMKIP